MHGKSAAPQFPALPPRTGPQKLPNTVQVSVEPVETPLARRLRRARSVIATLVSFRARPFPLVLEVELSPPSPVFAAHYFSADHEFRTGQN
jgi:hypothetical protein